MTYLLFEIPMRQMLNANQRQHHMARAKTVAELRAHAQAELRYLDRPHHERAHCTVTIHWPDHRRRDAHNYYPTVKALIDGLVDGGLLPDDNDRHLIGPDLRVGNPDSAVTPKGHAVLEFRFEDA